MKKFLASAGFILFVTLLISGSYLNGVRIQRNAVAEVLALGGAVHYSDGLYLGGPEHPRLADKPPYHDLFHRVWGVEIQKAVPPATGEIELGIADIASTLEMNWLSVLQLNKATIRHGDMATIRQSLPKTEIAEN